MAYRQTLLLLSIGGLGACQPTPVTLLLPAASRAVTLHVDSICLPELAEFPLRLTLTNHTRYPVVLLFDSLAPPYERQVQNLYLVVDPDTFFLGVRVSGQPLVFRAKTATSFLAYAYFVHGKGHFDSFQHIHASFEKGRLVYRLNQTALQGKDIKQLFPAIDTLLLPKKLEASTRQAPLVERLSYPAYPAPMRREVRLR